VGVPRQPEEKVKSAVRAIPCRAIREVIHDRSRKNKVFFIRVNQS